jgi:predicted ATPase
MVAIGAWPIIEDMAVRVSSPVLIGRSSELERLAAGLERAREGQSSALLVAGEAGVGKTRLISALTGLAAEADVRVLSGGCIDLGEGSLPYAPVIEAFRGFVRRATPDELDAVVGHGRLELARLIPDLGAVPEGADSALSVGSAQGRLF